VPDHHGLVRVEVAAMGSWVTLKLVGMVEDELALALPGRADCPRLRHYGECHGETTRYVATPAAYDEKPRLSCGQCGQQILKVRAER